MQVVYNYKNRDLPFLGKYNGAGQAGLTVDDMVTSRLGILTPDGFDEFTECFIIDRC